MSSKRQNLSVALNKFKNKVVKADDLFIDWEHLGSILEKDLLATDRSIVGFGVGKDGIRVYSTKEKT